MKRLVTGAFVCLALVAFCSSPALAQRGGRRGGFGGRMMNPAMLIAGSEQLQKELKITDEQKEKLKTIGEEARAAGGGFGRGGRDLSDEECAKRREAFQKRMEETVAKIKAVLNDEQNQRLRGITLQVRGVAALVEPDIVKELKLSDETVKQLKTIAEETAKKQGEVYTGMGRDTSSEDWAKAREKSKQLQKDANEEAMAALTAEQKTALEKMKGEKIELQMPSWGGTGRGRGKGRDSDSKTDEKKT